MKSESWSGIGNILCRFFFVYKEILTHEAKKDEAEEYLHRLCIMS
jgi:hypothetical protein